MENEERNTQEMSEWDRQVCAHLDDLWNRHHSGELTVGDADILFANARARLERELKQQQAQRMEEFSTQPSNYAV